MLIEITTGTNCGQRSWEGFPAPCASDRSQPEHVVFEVPIRVRQDRAPRENGGIHSTRQHAARCGTAAPEDRLGWRPLKVCGDGERWLDHAAMTTALARQRLCAAGTLANKRGAAGMLAIARAITAHTPAANNHRSTAGRTNAVSRRHRRDTYQRQHGRHQQSSSSWNAGPHDSPLTNRFAGVAWPQCRETLSGSPTWLSTVAFFNSRAESPIQRTAAKREFASA